MIYCKISWFLRGNELNNGKKGNDAQKIGKNCSSKNLHAKRSSPSQRESGAPGKSGMLRSSGTSSSSTARDWDYWIPIPWRFESIKSYYLIDIWFCIRDDSTGGDGTPKGKQAAAKQHPKANKKSNSSSAHKHKPKKKQHASSSTSNHKQRRKQLKQSLRSSMTGACCLPPKQQTCPCAAAKAAPQVKSSFTCYAYVKSGVLSLPIFLTAGVAEAVQICSFGIVCWMNSCALFFQPSFLTFIPTQH